MVDSRFDLCNECIHISLALTIALSTQIRVFALYPFKRFLYQPLFSLIKGFELRHIAKKHAD